MKKNTGGESTVIKTKALYPAAIFLYSCVKCNIHLVLPPWVGSLKLTIYNIYTLKCCTFCSSSNSLRNTSQTVRKEDGNSNLMCLKLEYITTCESISAHVSQTQLLLMEKKESFPWSHATSWSNRTLSSVFIVFIETSYNRNDIFCLLITNAMVRHANEVTACV